MLGTIISQRWNGYFYRENISSVLGNNWTLKGKDIVQNLGDNKHGHTIWLEIDHTFCIDCDKCVVFCRIVQLIIGSAHIEIMQNYKSENQ